MVASGMVDNLSVTHLNLSHNKIADRGVSFAPSKPVFLVLNLFFLKYSAIG
jgi:hypothetical protein